MARKHGVMWSILIGWWLYPIYLVLIGWWWIPLKKLIDRKKTPVMPIVLLDKFRVVTWGEDLERLKQWQADHARYQWHGNYTEKRTYEYGWTEDNNHGSLRPEPDNTYDPNAVAVYLGNFKIGYVPHEVNAVCHDKLIKQPLITINIYGGRYKYKDTDGEIITCKTDTQADVSIRRYCE